MFVCLFFYSSEEHLQRMIHLPPRRERYMSSKVTKVRVVGQVKYSCQLTPSIIYNS